MNHFDSEQEKVEVKSELESYASAEVYLSTMAHELKSPFSEIEVLTRFVREDTPDLSGEAEKHLGMIEDVCRRSKEAIGHFLELAHIGSAEINRSVIPMTDLVR